MWKEPIGFTIRTNPKNIEFVDGEQQRRIRTDPAARVTPLLQNLFGS
jgi:hypothetical protein